MILHRGKIARNPEILEVRALTREDLGVLATEGRMHGDRIGTGSIKRLRDPHRRIARLIAAGLRNHEIAERTGTSYNRISILRSDPAMMELVARMRERVDAAFEREQDEYAKLAMGNMLKAEAMIAEKLEIAEEEGETLPTRDLIAISRDAADRFGYGKRQTNLNVNADFASLLEKARARSGSAREPTTIEGKVLPATPPQSPRQLGVPATTPDAGALSQPVARAESPALAPAPTPFRRRA